MATTIVTKKGSGAPAASDLVEGELAVDTTNGRLYTENSSAAVVELGSNPSGNITFGDNGKAIFGAGSDLEIYHTGSDSRILDNGTGNLRIMANNLRMQSALGEQYIVADDGGAVTLYYDNAAKLATTATGIDVTGTVTADGLTVDGGADGSTSYARFTEYSSGYGFNGAYASYKGSSNELIFGRHNTFDSLTANDIPVMSIARSTGDISFYEDTGTTAKLFWDASAEALGIGTTSPATTLHVSSGSNGEILRVQGADAQLRIDNSTSNVMNINSSGSGDSLTLSTNDTERMRIDASGNVGIGSTSPSSTFRASINGDGSSVIGGIEFRNAAAGGSTFTIGHASATSPSAILNVVEAANLVFKTSNTEAMRIDSSGSVGIGETSLTAKLHIKSDGAVSTLSRMNNTAAGTAASNTIIFQRSGTNVGFIQVTGSATSYITSSDYRLKDNIVDAPSASDDIDAIQVRSFDWKADGEHQKYGMVAQELQSVAPEAVSAPEDPEEMMGVDYSKLVPMMLKEIQSLRARVAQLES